ncbi:SDR family oxidoreductase [Roseicyclus sp. F158]|uniref:SDR family oxidoreductase n=1 Tax=Tropicimonas omnivorans TaxID=3075590 RepID=A0ABU3DEB5_9RHOB|nr:SDR family oxidoreductase [Roseicyclus sp. F158]MDT0682020.1 SDR family oxidoreductase [Roseicyclus sp. F158]
MAELVDSEHSRVAFVTGAGQGLGKAIGLALAQAGHSVVFADIDADRAEAAAGDVGPAALGVSVDVRDRASVEAAAERARNRFGPIGILVNNAARTVAQPFAQLTETEWDDVFAVNLRGILLTTQTMVPDMVDAGWGRIINLSSLAGQRGGPQVQGAHYASSKAAIIGLSRYIAHEYASYGITANVIAPGPILTEATALAPKDKLDLLASQIPVGRFGAARDVGALACHLASTAGAFITGATMDINGGLQMR